MSDIEQRLSAIEDKLSAIADWGYFDFVKNDEGFYQADNSVFNVMMSDTGDLTRRVDLIESKLAKRK